MNVRMIPKTVWQRMSIFLLMAIFFGYQIAAVEAAKKGTEKIIFGYLPNEEAADVNQKSGREMLMNAMTDYVGMPVEIIICDDYNAVIEAMRNEKVQIAQFGPFSYIIASSRSNAEAVCVTSKDAQNAFYQSYLVTNSSSSIQTVQDIRGKSMAFVDPASTSGNLVPRSMIVANLNVNPLDIESKVFSSVMFAGNHTNSIMAAANKSVDVAAVASTTYDQSIQKNLIKEDDVRIIIKSDPIPSSPIAISGKLSTDIKQKLISFFQTYDNPEYFKLRKQEGYKFIPIKDSDYDGIRKIAKDMKLSPEELLK